MSTKVLACAASARVPSQHLKLISKRFHCSHATTTGGEVEKSYKQPMTKGPKSPPIQHCSNLLLGRPGELSSERPAKGPFMLEAVAAGRLPKLTFECAVEGRFRLISHFAGNFRYSPRRVLKRPRS